MLKLNKLFSGLSNPRFHYNSLKSNISKQITIPKPEKVTLYIKDDILRRSNEGIQVGDKVKTGQKLYLSKESHFYTVSSITGKIELIEPVISNFGASYTSITISSSNNNKNEHDMAFNEASLTPSLENMVNFLANSPGEPPLLKLLEKINSIHTILVYGGNSDLMIYDNFHRIVLDDSKAFNKGINLLKAATGINNAILVLPENTLQNYSGHLDATIKTVPSHYPSSQPLMLEFIMTGNISKMENIFSNGVCLFKTEAIASIGHAFEKKTVPIKKYVTIVNKDLTKFIVKVHIGTTIHQVFKVLGIKINDGDKIIFGGPMTGYSVFTEAQPILPDTETILIQREESIHRYSNYPCTNCGECVRICPANVPVNLLVRFLEAGRYEEGSDLYDLYSCIECGLCSYTCIAKIPIFQYIKLAKYELYRTGYAKEITE